MFLFEAFNDVFSIYGYRQPGKLIRNRFSLLFYWHGVSHIHISKLILTLRCRISEQTTARCLPVTRFS